MGGCLIQSRERFFTPIDYNKINVDELIDKWSSGEVLMMKDRVDQFCLHRGRKRMTREMLLEFFPAISRNFVTRFQQRLFSFFDWSHNSQISSKQLINGLSVLLKIQDQRFHQILYSMYRNPSEHLRHRHITGDEFITFFNQNRKMLSQDSSKPGQSLSQQKIVSLRDFKQFMAKHYNIAKFRAMFDVDRSEDENQLMSELEKNGYRIRLVDGEIVFAVEIKWFESWKHYVEHKYRLPGEIRFTDERNSKYVRPGVPVSAESILFKHGQGEIYMKPRMIDNQYLEGEFEDEIKQGLQLFQDFVVVTQPIWNCLRKVYGGGPQFKRRYPQIWPVVINKVFINHSGQFIADTLKKYLIGFRNHLTDSVIKQQQTHPEMIIYKKNLGDNVWLKLDLKKTVGENDICTQGFVCVVRKQAEGNFLANYSTLNVEQSKSQRRLYGFGDLVSVKVDKEVLLGYIMEMGKDSTTVFFRNKPAEAKQVISYTELTGLGALKLNKTVTLVAGLKNLGNSCYMNAVIQAVIATPVLNDFLVSNRYVNYLSEANKPKKQKLIIHNLSQLVQRTTADLTPVRPTQLRKSIVTKIPQFDNYDQQDAQQFLCSFLNTLSQQTLTQKVSLTKTIDLQALQADRQNYSVFDKFFLGQIVQKLKCLNCQATTITKQNTYSLSIPVPEIECAFYFAKFYPARRVGVLGNSGSQDANFGSITKYGVMVKKNVMLEELAARFAQQIGLPVGRLVFAVVQNGGVRVVFMEHHFKRRLGDLHLRESDDMMIYQEKLAMANFQKYPQHNTGRPKTLPPMSSSFPQYLQPGTYADIYYFYQWQICQFVSLNKGKAQVKVQTLEGQNQFPIRCLAPYLSHTIKKRVQLVVVHRKYDHEKRKLVTFSIPFLVSIGEWMQWNEIVDVINSQAERFIDREYYLKCSVETPNPDDPSFQPVLRRGYSSGDIGENQRERRQSVSNANNTIANTHHNKPSSTSQLWSTKVPYTIKILSKIDDTCSICGGLTRLDNQPYNKRHDYYSNSYLDKECPGCSVKQNMPITLLVNLHNVYFSLDWSETLAFRADLTRVVSHQSAVVVGNEQREMRNPLEECLRSFGKEEEGIERRCENQKCRFQWSTMQTFIRKSPNILIIHLKRFKMNNGYLQKMQNRIQIPHSVSLNSLAYEKMPDNKYQLFAIVCHKGSGFGGHYISYVFKNKKTWVKCDDDVTTIVEFASINLTEVYLIFYRKLNMPSSLLAM